MRSRALDAAASGWSLAIHAIGDTAVDFAVETLEEATARYGAPSMPHRIEHGGVVRPDQIERLRGQPIVVVPQPLFISAFGDAMAEALGPQRAALSYPGKRLLDASLVLPGSSDQPVAPGRPLDVMQAFVERRTASGELYGPQDRLTPAGGVGVQGFRRCEPVIWAIELAGSGAPLDESLHDVQRPARRDGLIGAAGKDQGCLK